MNCPRSCTVQVRYLNARLGPFRTHAPAEQVQWQRGMNVGQGLNRGVIASHVFMGGGNRTTKVPVGSHSNTFGYSLPRSETSRPFRTVLTLNQQRPAAHVVLPRWAPLPDLRHLLHHGCGASDRVWIIVFAHVIEVKFDRPMSFTKYHTLPIYLAQHFEPVRIQPYASVTSHRFRRHGSPTCARRPWRWLITLAASLLPPSPLRLV